MVEGCEAPNKVITKVLDFKLVLEDSKDFAKHKIRSRFRVERFQVR